MDYIKIVREQYIKRYLKLLQWVYSTDPEELDIDEEYEWSRGDRLRADSIDEQKDLLGYIYREYGRRRVVSNVTTGLVSMVSDEGSLFFFLLTELCEVQLCIDENQILPAVVRGASMLHQSLRSRLDSDGKFGSVISDASEKEIITEPQLKLVQFIRLVRNDAAHNFSYQTEYAFAVHHHAADCVVTLLISLMESWFGYEWFDVGLFVESRLSVEQCIRVIEGEFGFEWDSGKGAYSDSSLSEKYDNT